jgi:F-type H+-transporting ATPase subunit delta
MAEYVTLARPYAKAAFDYAKNAGLVDSWMRDLEVSAGLASVKEVAQAFTSPEKDNNQLVAMLVGDNVDQGYKNLIQLMADNDRLMLLPDVATLFKHISEEDAKELSADVFSADELDQQQLDKISAALAKRTGKSINLKQHIDKSLLSGARIVAGDLVIDGSLKAKLEKLKTELLN